MTAVASYFATLGFRVSRAELRKVDQHLKSIEVKLKKFGKGLDNRLKLNLKIDKFAVDDKKLRLTIGNALDVASKTTTFEISKFAVNDRNLRAALLGASRRMGNMPGNAGGIGGTTYINNRGLSPQEWDRRQSVMHQNRMEQISARQSNQPPPRGRGQSGVVGGGVAGGIAGGTGYGLMRSMYAPMFFGGLGMYGLGQTNQLNQEVVSTEIAANAIFGDKSDQAKNFLKQHSDYVGYNYLDTMPLFTSFMASSMPLMGYDESENVFESLAEFGRTRGTDAVGMKRAMTAIQQMASKGQVMQEELKLQLSEARGFGESRAVFAEANQMRKGGSLTGAAAAAELMKDMERGEVMAADILPIVAKLLKEMAKGGIEEARKSSTAEQARFQNSITRSAQNASDNGLETGFARLFRTMTTALDEGQSAVESMARAFDKVSQYVSFIMLIPQSFKRAFEGRDSYMADILGEENIKIVKGFTEGLSNLTSEIKTALGFAIDGWGMIFGEFGDEMLNFAAKLSNILMYSFKALNQAMSGDVLGANNSLGAVRAALANKSPDEVKAIAEGTTAMPTLEETAEGWGWWAKFTPQALMYDKASEFMGGDALTGLAARVAGPGFSYGKPLLEGYWTDHYAEKGIEASQAMQQHQNNNITISEGAIVVNTQATDGMAVARDVESQLSTVIEGAMPSFNRKE